MQKQMRRRTDSYNKSEHIMPNKSKSGTEVLPRISTKDLSTHKVKIRLQSARLKSKI